MKNLKVLIYFNESYLAPIGGPSGYLYGLKQELDKLSDSGLTIDFIPREDNLSSGFKSFSKNSKNSIIVKLLNFYREYKVYRAVKNTLKCKKSPAIDISQYDIIHFHSTREFYLLRESLKNYKGITVLTSHSPQPLSCELTEGLAPWAKRLIGQNNNLIVMDRYAFENADYILFPCEYADEPYIHEWDYYSQIKAKRIKSYRYIETGTVPANIKTDRDEIRAKYNIPKDAFVVCYVGRHNEIKGYDKLKEIGKKFLLAHPDAYFLIAGREGPLYGIENPHWIEIGWTNEPHSFVNASDVFILPNKETYFDLVMLEVLSTGKISLVSETGGNKLFKKFKNAGIYYYDDVEAALNQLEVISSLNCNDRKVLEKENKKIFNENFTTDIFAKKYIDMYKSLVNKG